MVHRRRARRKVRDRAPYTYCLVGETVAASGGANLHIVEFVAATGALAYSHFPDATYPLK